MKPIWVKVPWWPITDGGVLYPFIFLKHSRWDTPTFRHEVYHWLDIRFTGWFRWYSGYLKELIIAMKEHRSPWSISYELRAIAAEADSNYDGWGPY